MHLLKCISSVKCTLPCWFSDMLVIGTNVSSEDAGTLAQVSLNLHMYNAEQRDSGVYQCGVWTRNGSGEFRSMQHLMYCMHLRSMPPTNETPGSLLPHAQTHV